MREANGRELAPDSNIPTLDLTRRLFLSLNFLSLLIDEYSLSRLCGVAWLRVQ